MPRRRLLRAALAAGLLTAALAHAQEEMPSIGGMPAATPAAPAAPAPRTTPAAAASGTTIIGERESPIGLYIMPWRESRPQEDMDRPARLLQEKLLPLDEKVFVRQIEYHNALSKALKQKGVVTPGER